VIAGLQEQSPQSQSTQSRSEMNRSESPAIVPVKAGAQTDAGAARRRIAQMIGLLFGTTEFQRK
jgi:hypothetical protein